jgi:hypothetical protein
MWVQFRNIPFYLLTKKLTRDLGEKVGTLVKIDNNSRGNICDKFLRARVQLPLYMALQKEITLMDEITNEEVDVQLRYERLPNFCLFCGYIGHMEARCDTPVEGRKLCFSQDLRVPPVHFEDPRTWFLPEAMGQPQSEASSQVPWRAPNPAPWPAPWVGVLPAARLPRTNHALPGVEKVVAEVARLCVNDNNNNTSRADAMEAAGGDAHAVATMTLDVNNGVIGDTTGNNIDINGPVMMAALDTSKGAAVVTGDDREQMENIIQNKMGAAMTHDGNNGVAAAPLGTTTNGANKVKEKDEAVANNNGQALLMDNIEHEARKDVVASNGPLEENPNEADISASISANMKNTKGWKRKNRKQVVEQAVSKLATPKEHQRLGSGMVRTRLEEDDAEEELMHSAKRGHLQVPSLSECLGKEGLQMLHQAEENRKEKQKVEDGGKETEESKEATGPGATGPLSGAKEGAWQEP